MASNLSPESWLSRESMQSHFPSRARSDIPVRCAVCQPVATTSSSSVVRVNFKRFIGPVTRTRTRLPAAATTDLLSPASRSKFGPKRWSERVALGPTRRKRRPVFCVSSTVRADFCSPPPAAAFFQADSISWSAGKFIAVWREKESALAASQLTNLLLQNASHEGALLSVCVGVWSAADS